MTRAPEGNPSACRPTPTCSSPRPLLALQQDQIDGIESSSAGVRAVRISSAESEAARDEALDAAAAGEVELLFLAPEQLANPEVRARMAAIGPSLVAVDETHCVSTWGHDVRPDHFRLGDLLVELGLLERAT